MDLDRLNPYVRRASLLETDTAGDFRTAPDARCFFSLSGDLAFEIESEKKKHLTPGNFLYLPAGTVYKLKSKYFRAVVLNFDLTYEEGAPADRLSAYSLPLPEGAVIRRTEDAAPFDRPLYIEDMAAEKDAFLRMANLFVSALGDYRATVSALLKLELLRVAEITDENALPTRMVEAMDEYIREHCGEELSNTEIGAIFGDHPAPVHHRLPSQSGALPPRKHGKNGHRYCRRDGVHRCVLFYENVQSFLRGDAERISEFSERRDIIITFVYKSEEYYAVEKSKTYTFRH